MSTRHHILAADWTWTGSRFEPNFAVDIGPDGTIASVGPLDPDRHVTHVKNRALLPGFVNAHCHAFQRGLRSEPQRFDTGAGNFWTWRETMYRLAQSLDPAQFYDVSKQCFQEMLQAGITTVGEFHYLHHAGDAARWVFDDAILAAARDAGIRLVLIQTYYATGGINQPLQGAQLRFGPISRPEFVRQLDRLAARIDPQTQSLALACHSIRAVSIDDLIYFRDYATRSQMPFHIHVEEARKEIDDCIAAYGKNPLALLLENLTIDQHVTAIHCTHSKPDDLREWCARGGRICLCPLTEGNLSDGFPDVPGIRAADGSICIGSDSNIRISMIEELRMLEFAQRARRGMRGVIVDDARHCAAALVPLATVNGAASLGLRVGRIEPDAPADLISIDLDHPSMRGARPEAILDSLIFGSGNGPVEQVWISGVRSRGR